jgi:hypothetical protein
MRAAGKRGDDAIAPASSVSVASTPIAFSRRSPFDASQMSAPRMAAGVFVGPVMTCALRPRSGDQSRDGGGRDRTRAES